MQFFLPWYYLQKVIVVTVSHRTFTPHQSPSRPTRLSTGMPLATLHAMVMPGGRSTLLAPTASRPLRSPRSGQWCTLRLLLTMSARPATCHSACPVRTKCSRHCVTHGGDAAARAKPLSHDTKLAARSHERHGLTTALTRMCSIDGQRRASPLAWSQRQPNAPCGWHQYCCAIAGCRNDKQRISINAAGSRHTRATRTALRHLESWPPASLEIRRIRA